jgi:hypothetical protein
VAVRAGAIGGWLCVFGVGVFLAACAKADDTAIQGQVQGLVRAGPTCPVERAGQICPPRPVAGQVQAEDARGAVVASTDTDAAGHYLLTVKPASYTLVVDVSGPFPRCPTTLVTVKAAVTSSVNIDCDTGIR